MGVQIQAGALSSATSLATFCLAHFVLSSHTCRKSVATKAKSRLFVITTLRSGPSKQENAAIARKPAFTNPKHPKTLILVQKAISYCLKNHFWSWAPVPRPQPTVIDSKKNRRHQNTKATHKAVWSVKRGLKRSHSRKDNGSWPGIYTIFYWLFCNTL